MMQAALNGHIPGQHQIVGTVDHAHSAAAELLVWSAAVIEYGLL